VPGEVTGPDGVIVLNAGAPTTVITVVNTGDRPVQVGSHFHFAETNAALAFDRKAARGFRLNIAAGTAVRFEPGQVRTVELVALAGDRIVIGFNAAVMGRLDAKKSVTKSAAKKSATKRPAVKQPAVKQPVAKKPAVKQPVAKKPAVKQPVVKQPAAKGRR